MIYRSDGRISLHICNRLVEEDVQMTEMWLVPTDVSEVDKIYTAMTQCQALHPDPNDSCSDDEGVCSNIHVFFVR